MQTSWLCHGRLTQHHARWEHGRTGYVFSRVLWPKPPHVLKSICLLSFAESHSHFLKAKLHQSGHNISGYDYNVCVIGIDHQGYVNSYTACRACRKIRVSICSWLHGATASSLPAWLLIASSPLRHYDYIGCCHFRKFISNTNGTIPACCFHLLRSFASLMEFYMCLLLSSWLLFPV